MRLLTVAVNLTGPWHQAALLRSASELLGALQIISPEGVVFFRLLVVNCSQARICDRAYDAAQTEIVHL